MSTKAITGNLSITTSDGVQLEDTTDIGLAWQWAEREVDAQLGAGSWEAMPYRERWDYVGGALAELRRAFGAASGDSISE